MLPLSSEKSFKEITLKSHFLLTVSCVLFFSNMEKLKCVDAILMIGNLVCNSRRIYDFCNGDVIKENSV